MDSLTQIVLGASVGELVAGKKLGNKAIIWGAVAGTIPDLDVLLNPFVSEINKLVVHRGFSHSFAFAILFAPIFGFILSKIYKKSEAGFKDWSLLFFWGIVTHFMLDVFTNYGTQIFTPFSDLRVSWNTIFVIDPLYTLPFMGFVIAAMFYKRNSKTRQLLNYAGLTISSVYLLFTVVNKQYINSIFKEAAQSQNIKYTEFMSTPTPLNNILWRALFKSDDGYYEGYYSWFDDSKEIKFRYIPSNGDTINNLGENGVIKTLKWFSNGYYTITSDNKNIYFNDIRFGTIGGWNSSNSDYIFSFRILMDDNVRIESNFEGMDISAQILNEFLDRIFGKKDNNFI